MTPLLVLAGLQWLLIFFLATTPRRAVTDFESKHELLSVG
jgi:hypothetical protein